jgi:hypothetical protein
VEASIQEKVTASISKEKRDLQSVKFGKSAVNLAADPQSAEAR